jgi:hypothetical protein
MKKIIFTIIVMAMATLTAAPQALKAGFENLQRQKYDDAA